jgi:hypothetical protein
MPRYATTTTTAESVSQAASPTGVRGSSPARARTATTDWLAAVAGPPIRPVWKTTALQ